MRKFITVRAEIVSLIPPNRRHIANIPTFQKRITEYLKKKFSLVSKIYYVTDGAAQHFKKKYPFSNLLNHKKISEFLQEHISKKLDMGKVLVTKNLKETVIIFNRKEDHIEMNKKLETIRLATKLFRFFPLDDFNRSKSFFSIANLRPHMVFGADIS